MLKKIVVAVALTLSAGGAVATAASAQTVSGESQSVTSSQPSGVSPNEAFRIFGSGCALGSVDVTFNGRTYEDVPVDSTGNWFLDVDAPGTPGTYTVSANCGGTVTTTEVQVLGEAAAPAALPRTGSSSTTPLARIGVGAIVGGGLLLAATRRRRVTA